MKLQERDWDILAMGLFMCIAIFFQVFIDWRMVY